MRAVSRMSRAPRPGSWPARPETCRCAAPASFRANRPASGHDTISLGALLRQRGGKLRVDLDRAMHRPVALLIRPSSGGRLRQVRLVLLVRLAIVDLDIDPARRHAPLLAREPDR